MILATLFAQQYTKHCSCKQCRNLCSCEDCNEITLYSRIRNTMSVVQTIYETGSLYKTKGGNNSIIHYYFKQLYSVFDRIHCAIHLKRYGCIPELKPFIRIQGSKDPYRTTDFSWPTRSRVFNIMSNPASSTFLQNATSSLHISTSSTPSFPRIL